MHTIKEINHTQSPFNQARSVPNGQKKTVFDAWNGYHSIPLYPDDHHYTTFITPWGDISIGQPNKATYPRKMDTPECMMRYSLNIPIQNQMHRRWSYNYKDRIVIPPALRQDCLSTLHTAHQGTSSMTARAEASIFWPGITSDISSTVSNCRHCTRMAPTQPHLPPTPPILMAYPFQCICVNYFNHQATNYLVIVARYSNWQIVERSGDRANGLIKIQICTFTTYGILDELSQMEDPNSLFTPPELSYMTGESITD